MSNFEKFPSVGNNEEEEKKIEEEGSVIDEFEGDENKIENDESETEGTNKSKSKGGKRSGFVVGALSALALFQGGVKEAKSAEDMFADKTIDKTEQMVKSEMESEENSQEASEFKFTIKKVKDLLTDEQLDALVDSTGMVNTSQLIYKIKYYHQELKAITYNKNKKDMGVAAVEFAKMHRIPGTVIIYDLEGNQMAGSISYETDTGKLKTDLLRIGDVPTAFPKDKIKNVQIVFASK